MFDITIENPYSTSTTNAETGKTDALTLVVTVLFKIFRIFVSILILPAQLRPSVRLTDQQLENISSQYAVTTTLGTVRPYDEASLETIEITPSALSSGNIKDKKFIIKLVGNGKLYQDFIHSFAADAKRLNVTVIGFNYRGVGNSKKSPLRQLSIPVELLKESIFQDIVTDGLAQVQRLLKSGALPEHILLDGHSFGAGVATAVTEHFHRLDVPIFLWNDRSFASLSKAAAGLMSPFAITQSSSFTQTLERLAQNVLEPAEWDFDAARSYQRIPEKHKSYMVVAQLSAKSTGDGVISHQASLHMAIKDKQGTPCIVLGTSMFGDHNTERKKLICEHNSKQNGEDIFDSFVAQLGKQK